MIRTFAVCSLALAIFSAPLFAEDGEKPVGQRVDHLNFVFSVTDPDATIKFYGDILGMKRVADIDFPGDSYMIRYMGGKSEIKFIVTGQQLPKMEGGVGKARGIRLLAFLLPESQRAGIVERMKAAGLPEPTFTERRNEALAYNYRYGMTYDYDGNQIELVFLDEGAPAEKFDQVQMGCIVSDMAAMDKFLGEVLGAKPFVVDDRIHRYDVGASQVKFWQVNGDLPAWVGGPMEKVGMNLIQFIVPDVDAVRAEVVARGGKINREPFPLGQLATIMFVEGPDGILFEFAGPLAPRFRQ